MRIPRILGVVLVAVMVAAAVGTLVVMNRQGSGAATPAPPKPSGSDSGSVAVVKRVQPSLVRVERGVAPSPSSAAASGSGEYPGGTGVVIDARGYILTAEAVVAGASTISAVIPGGTTLRATVVGSDPQDALTLLKVDSGGLRPISTTGTPELVNGSAVVVLGAPAYGEFIAGAVADVHASASITDPSDPSHRRPLNDLIALDVAQREGQLGALVLDGAGRLAGIVVAGDTQAYAVNMMMAQPLVQQLVDSGHVSYPSLGFEYRQLSLPEAAVRGVPGGVLVVSAGQAAKDAGLKAGDVVMSADGTTLDPAHALSRILRGMAVRQGVALLVSDGAGQRHLVLNVQLLSP